MRYLVVLLLLAGCTNEAPVGRYQFHALGGGYALRLDTRTGEIERCIVVRAHGVCGVNPEDDVTAMRR